MDSQNIQCDYRDASIALRCESVPTHKIISRERIVMLCEKHTKEKAQRDPLEVLAIFDLEKGEEVTIPFLAPYLQKLKGWCPGCGNEISFARGQTFLICKNCHQRVTRRNRIFISDTETARSMRELHQHLQKS